jgi:hypothetical protein
MKENELDPNTQLEKQPLAEIRVAALQLTDSGHWDTAHEKEHVHWIALWSVS